MKKIIFLTLTIMIMFLFVGCGIQNQLADTKWKMQETTKYYSIIASYEFKENGDLIEIETVTVDGESESYDPAKGKWFYTDNTLFIEGTNIEGYYTVEMKKDEMLLTQEQTYVLLKLTKIN